MVVDTANLCLNTEDTNAAIMGAREKNVYPVAKQLYIPLLNNRFIRQNCIGKEKNVCVDINGREAESLKGIWTIFVLLSTAVLTITKASEFLELPADTQQEERNCKVESD